MLPVSFDGELPVFRTVQPRTMKLAAGVLCDVWVDEQMHLCIVDRVNADGSIVARRLPSPPAEIGITRPHRDR